MVDIPETIDNLFACRYFLENRGTISSVNWISNLDKDTVELLSKNIEILEDEAEKEDQANIDDESLDLVLLTRFMLTHDDLLKEGNLFTPITEFMEKSISVSDERTFTNVEKLCVQLVMRSLELKGLVKKTSQDSPYLENDNTEWIRTDLGTDVSKELDT